jgi:dihydrofolate reductase
MADLVYTAITSLDGYTADRDGGFDWAAPDEEVHTFVNELEREIGCYLYGRRIYDTMVVWQTMGDAADDSAAVRDYAQIWRAADKVVYSRTLTEPRSPRTRIESEFDPVAVRELKAGATSNLGIGGPGLAAHAVRAGLVDEWHQFLTPVVVGGGTPWLPDEVTLSLELVDERRFGNGVMHLHYRTRR